MSWYQAADGHDIWVPRNETVYTVIQPESHLRTEELMYLSMAATKPVFKEHIEEDNDWDIGRNKKRNMKRAGKQRGFLIRVDPDEHARVVPWFKTACRELIAAEICSKIDADEALNVKKQKKRFDRGGPAVGVNECRVETVSRCHHVACGPGFKVEVVSDMVRQHIHFFTEHQVMPAPEWYSHLTKAVEKAYGRVFTARKIEVSTTPVPGGGESGDDERDHVEADATATGVQSREVLVAPARADAQLAEEEEWLDALMGAASAAGSEEEGQGKLSSVPEPSAPPVAGNVNGCTAEDAPQESTQTSSPNAVSPDTTLAASSPTTDTVAGAMTVQECKDKLVSVEVATCPSRSHCAEVETDDGEVATCPSRSHCAEVETDDGEADTTSVGAASGVDSSPANEDYCSSDQESHSGTTWNSAWWESSWYGSSWQSAANWDASDAPSWWNSGKWPDSNGGGSSSSGDAGRKGVPPRRSTRVCVDDIDVSFADNASDIVDIDKSRGSADPGKRPISFKGRGQSMDTASYGLSWWCSFGNRCGSGAGSGSERAPLRHTRRPCANDMDLSLAGRPSEIIDIDEDEHVPWAALGVRQPFPSSMARGSQSRRDSWRMASWQAPSSHHRLAWDIASAGERQWSGSAWSDWQYQWRS